MTVGAPTYKPGAKGSIVAIDSVTGTWYVSRDLYAANGNWLSMGQRIEQISGCSAPAYTPNKYNSDLVINNCAVPELYYHSGGGVWVQLNASGSTYTAGTGIAISGGNVISNIAPDQTVSLTGAGGNVITGTYPSFTITGTPATGAETIVTAGTGVSVSGAGTSGSPYVVSSSITQYTDENAQDAVGAMVGNTLTYTDATPLLDVKTQMSITSDASGVKLSGDAASPGNSKLYGTDGSGVKGWQSQPTGTTDLSISGSSSPLTINSSTGTDITATAGTGISLAGTSGNFTISNTGVTSAGLSLPSIFSVSGSPVTTTGTLTGTLATQTANTVFAGPASGGAATPAFRALVAADMPSGTITGSGATNQMTYWTGTTSQAGASTLIWDNANVGLNLLSSTASSSRGFNSYLNLATIAGASMTFYKSRGTYISPVASNNGDLVGSFSFRSYVGGAYSVDRCFFGGNHTSSTGQSLFFITGSTDNNYTPSLLVYENGYVGVGPTGGSIVSTITAPVRRLHVIESDAVTSAVTYSQRNTHVTSGTAAIGFGQGHETELENASGTNRVAQVQQTTWSDAVNATEDATYELKLMRAGTLTAAQTTLSTGETTFSGDVTVPDEVYGSGWDASLEVPTKNAVYDKVEALNVTAGTYTPTLTGVTNVTASTPFNCQYSRNGNIVTVFGSLSITTTLAVATEVGISLPIASALAAATDANGIANASSAIASNGYLEADATNDRASLKFIGLSVSGAGTLFFSFSYTVL